MTDANWGIAGNERAIGALLAAVANGSPNHGYLLAGPAGVGRSLAALRLAQALNCTGPDLGGQHLMLTGGEEAPAARPCLQCDQCRRIANGIHSDVQTVTVEANAEGAAHKAISVEQLRDVEASVALAPYEGRTRVVIIDPADDMTDQAQNAFLKTLEEPPPNVVFVLVANDAGRLLETIRSRCSRIDFHLVAAGEIEDSLVAQGIDPAQAKLLARLSGGRAGWAIDAARDPQILERRGQALATARAILQMPLADRFDLAERLSDAFKRDREPVLWQIEQWQSWWRDVLLVQSEATEGIANLDMNPDIEQDAAITRQAEVARFLQALSDARANLIGNVQSRIALDALMLAVPPAHVLSTRSPNL